jgi:hypothetical protein
VGAVSWWPVPAAAVVAAGGVVLLAHTGSAPKTAPPAAVTVEAALDRSVLEFGDAVTARVVIALDRDAVRPQTLHVVDDLAPLTTLSARTETRTVSGRLETVSLIQRVACLTTPCLARAIALPHIRVTVTTRSGAVTRVTASWRPLQLRSRVTAADLAATTPHLAGDTAVAPPSYRLAPGTASVVLDIVAALTAAGAAAILALEALRFRRRRRHVDGDELSRALRLVREAERRPPSDRRRALALLARLLHGHTLERNASDLAWSRPVPEPQPVEALVSQVEEENAG